MTQAINALNPAATVFPVDALEGYGVEPLAEWLRQRPPTAAESDVLRHTMPSGVCSYCVGERRVGAAFQQGVVGKIDFSAGACPPVRKMQMAETAPKTACPDVQTLTICPGTDKSGAAETFAPIVLKRGMLYAIVGNTGSGKSRLIKDVEQLVSGDSVTGRTVLLNGKAVASEQRRAVGSRLVAHLSQNMRFVLDITVSEFLSRHALCRGKEIKTAEIVALANEITPEPIHEDSSLSQLSGGQSRALMIADIAAVCDSPVVLIDEIENAGIDKEKAFDLLCGRDKLVLAVTHDPHTALMSEERIILAGGAIEMVVMRSASETLLYHRLENEYRVQKHYQALLRKGEQLS